MTRSTAMAWMALLGAVLAGCKRSEGPPPPARSVPVPVVAPAPSASAAREWTLPDVRSEEKDEAPDPPRVDGGAFAAGTPSDLGPAGPAAASRFGVVMISKRDEVVLAAPGKTRGSFQSVRLVASAFDDRAPPPAIAGEHAYFVSGGKLVRRRIPTPGPVEVLAAARARSRVAALPAAGGRPALAAFIADPDRPTGSATAMLWVEGGELLRLSPEGAGASSVAMVDLGESVQVAVLDGRTGMTPVHVRRVTFGDGKPKLDENVVVWVAGPAQPTTELTLAATAEGSWIFSALERETTRFGLAMVRLGTSPGMGSPVEWRMYPNGSDPSPMAVAQACGERLLVYAQPATDKPGADHQIHLAVLTASGLAASDVLGTAPPVRSLSASGDADSLLVVYSAGSRTFALSAPCPRRPARGT